MPYKLNKNNQIDLFAALANIVTMFSAFIFSIGNNLLPGFYFFTLIIIFAFNAIFLIRWTFHLLVAFEWKNEHFQRILMLFSLVLREHYTEFNTSTSTLVQHQDQDLAFRLSPKPIIKKYHHKKRRNSHKKKIHKKKTYIHKIKPNSHFSSSYF